MGVGASSTKERKSTACRCFALCRILGTLGEFGTVANSEPYKRESLAAEKRAVRKESQEFIFITSNL